MTTPAQGKGKKKNKESTKFSLEEFNSFDAPHGHNVVSIKTTGTGLDWAEAMADQQVTETQQIIVPTAPRAQRGPDIEFDSLPETGPFRVSLFNLPMSVEEKEIRERIFQELDVVRIESTKSNTTVELGSRNDLYQALCKDGISIKGRTVNVLLFGQQPQNSYGSDRYGGGRGGNSSFGDRYGDRDRGGFGGQRGGPGMGRYGDRPSGGGFTRDRDSSYGGGFNRSAGGGYGQPRGGGGGFGDRYNDRFGDRQIERFSDRPNERFSNDRPIERFNDSRPIERGTGFINRPPPPSSEGFNDRFERPGEQRQKLDLKKRTTPLNLDDVSRNEAIFGQAKPSSKPYEKLMEIEEKLKGKE